MITVFTKNNCFPCKLTKKWLTEHGFGFTEINIDDDLSSLGWCIEKGYKSAPVVLIDDELVALGFQPHELAKHLQ